MARMFLRRTLTGFVPADLSAEELCKGYKIGDIYKADVVKPRSYQHHKLAFALLSLTFKNQERYSVFDDFRKAVTLAAGHSREFVSLDGEVMREPGSLAFDALDEVEFTKVMAAMMSVCAHILHDMDEADLAAQVGIYADQHYGNAA